MSVTIPGPPPNLKINQVYFNIYQKYPQLVSVDFKLINNGKILDITKTINDYAIGYNNSTVIADIPPYLLSSKGLLK